MSVRLPLVLSLLLLPLAPLSAQAQVAQPLLEGDYRLAGTYDTGAVTTARISLRELPSGELEVEREGRIRIPGPDPRFTWTGVGFASSAHSITVTFDVPTGDAANPSNTFVAAYTLSDDGRTLDEVVSNHTQFAPEAGWSQISGAAARDLEDLTYGELAKQTIPPLWVLLLDELRAFNATTLPHEAKDLRKRIGLVRAYLDLFSFAYPGSGSYDPFLDLRGALDNGYESMGEFKDLYDAQGVADPTQAVYDPNEVRVRRERVLDWLADFMHAPRLNSYAYYVSRPRRRAINDERDKDDLSPYYWGEAEIEPKRSLSGIENMARLMRSLLERAHDDLPKVRKIKTLTKVSDQEHFHSFRKALRTAVKLSGYFPGVFDEDENPTPEITLLDLTVDKFGEINDKLVAHALAERRGQNRRAEDLEDEVEYMWEDLEDWLDDEDVGDEIEDLRSEVLD